METRSCPLFKMEIYQYLKEQLSVRLVVNYTYNKYSVIQNDCQGFNNLSYTIHLRSSSSSSYPVIPSGTQGVNKTSPSDPIPRQLLDFIPTLSLSQCLAVHWSPPRLLSPASLPLSLRIPIHNLSFDGILSFPYTLEIGLRICTDVSRNSQRAPVRYVTKTWECCSIT